MNAYGGSLLKIACAVPLLLCLASCAREEPIRIGYVGALTGRSADLGVSGRNGATLAVEERNAQGGISGRRIELIPRDDEQNPETARRVVAELIDLKVEAIIGPMTSAIAMAVVPLADGAKIPLVSPTVTTTALTGKDDYFFRVIATTREYAAKSARYLRKRKGVRRVAAIYDVNNRAYTETWVDNFKSTLGELGGEVPLILPFASGEDHTFLRQCRELLSISPDAVLIVSNAVDAGLIAQQIRKLDPQVQLVMAEWSATERLLEMGGKAVEGAVVDQYFDRNDPSPRFRQFVADYNRRFSLEPGFPGVSAYDAAQVLFAALARQKRGETLRDALLRERTYQGVGEPIPLDRYGDASRDTHISEIRDGKFVLLE